MLVKVVSETFIAPNKIAAGVLINYSGPWGPQFEPMDDESRRVAEEYYSTSPGSLDPTKDLPMTVGDRHRVVPAATVVSVVEPETTVDAQVAEKLKDPVFMAAFAKAMEQFNSSAVVAPATVTPAPAETDDGKKKLPETDKK